MAVIPKGTVRFESHSIPRAFFWLWELGSGRGDWREGEEEVEKQNPSLIWQWKEVEVELEVGATWKEKKKMNL